MSNVQVRSHAYHQLAIAWQIEDPAVSATTAQPVGRAAKTALLHMPGTDNPPAARRAFMYPLSAAQTLPKTPAVTRFTSPARGRSWTWTKTHNARLANFNYHKTR